MPADIRNCGAASVREWKPMSGFINKVDKVMAAVKRFES